MATRIHAATKNATDAMVPVSPVTQENTKDHQNLAPKEFLTDRFEDRDRCELAQFSGLLSSATEEASALKAFDLMLDEKSQSGGEFMISSPTGTVALWWGDLADLVRLLPAETSAKLTALDSETREILRALCEAAPHRRFTAAERRI